MSQSLSPNDVVELIISLSLEEAIGFRHLENELLVVNARNGNVYFLENLSASLWACLEMSPALERRERAHSLITSDNYQKALELLEYLVAEGLVFSLAA